jgi:2-haloacid dehalogenase
VALDTADVRALTFDCYGTIVDWDGGIAAALAALPSLEGADLARLVREREEVEKELQAGTFHSYGEVLGESLRRAVALQDRTPEDGEVAAFVQGMGDWPPFADSVVALGRLGMRFRLAILSNVETAVLRRSLTHVPVSFAELVTAEQVRSYKPARAHFDEALRRLDLEPREVLHVAGSLYHDVRPARELGWSAVWIDRRGEGAPDDLEPDRVFPDLGALADALGT